MRMHVRALSVALILFGCLGFTAAAEDAAAVKGPSIFEDLQYRQDAEGYAAERCKLDLYVPQSEEPVPILVWFHGGGLHAGGKGEDSVVVVARRLTSHGIAVALVNYRLSPQVSYPEYIRDAAASVAWVIRSCKRYGGDPSRVFVGGHSAGAYLTAMLALADPFLGEQGITRDEIAGLIPVSGQMRTHSQVCTERSLEAEERPIDEAAPLHNIRRDTPPWLILCAEGEEIEAENQQLHDALVAAGHQDCSLVRIPDRDHMGMVLGMTDPADPVTLQIIQFIRRLG